MLKILAKVVLFLLCPLAYAEETSWNAIGLIHFQPWKLVGFVGGYRALDVDYETGSGINKFKYDMLMHGPVVAVNFTW